MYFGLILFEESWFENFLASTFRTEERVICSLGRWFTSKCLRRHTDGNLRGDLRHEGSVVSFTLIYINTNQYLVSYIACWNCMSIAWGSLTLQVDCLVVSYYIRGVSLHVVFRYKWLEEQELEWHDGDFIEHRSEGRPS